MIPTPFIDKEVNCVNGAKVLQQLSRILSPKYTLFNCLYFHL